jgi:hypothetical protein
MTLIITNPKFFRIHTKNTNHFMPKMSNVMRPIKPRYCKRDHQVHNKAHRMIYRIPAVQMYTREALQFPNCGPGVFKESISLKIAVTADKSSS